MIVVVDASAIIDALMGVEGILRRLRTFELHAPVSVDAEFLHGMRRKWLARYLDAAEAVAVIGAFQSLPISRRPVAHLVDRMWALRNNITAYDAGYVALAESLGVPLVTRDRRLFNSSGHAARIEYID
jgi:predicted nucleic acid-binding protein